MGIPVTPARQVRQPDLAQRTLLGRRVRVEPEHMPVDLLDQLHTTMQLSGHRTANIFDRYDVHNTRDLEEATARLGSPMPVAASTN